MQLIFFVISLIMVLSVMTWSRLNTFIKSDRQAQEWIWLMNESERSVYNREELLCKAKKVEKEGTVNENVSTEAPPADVTKPKPLLKRKSGEKDLNPPKVPSTPKGSGQISLEWLFDKKFREKNPENFTKMQGIMERLIKEHWSDQPFYKRMSNARPDFVRQLILEIMSMCDEADPKEGEMNKEGSVPDNAQPNSPTPQNKNEKADQQKISKPKNLDDLIFLNWKDYELKVAFGRMLQPGLIYEREYSKKNKVEVIDGGAPEGELVSNTSYSATGFQSLKDYFSSNKNEKIRVWLAPRGLLMAIYDDKTIVESIINMRKDMYSEIRKSKGSKEKLAELSKRFEEAFKGNSPDNELLDYTVTSTDTRNR